LKELFSGDRLVLLQLVGLFRTTIQHRHRLRLLISGAAPFDELDKMWEVISSACRICELKI
jgi:hypothetical protein